MSSIPYEPVDNDIFFDRIVSIDEATEEDVYDIEVEGTHNFIGNDIVAHNTYLSNLLDLGDNNISNVGNIALDTISSDGAASPLTITATAGQQVQVEGVAFDNGVITSATSIDLGGTTLLASRSLTIDTGGVFDINLGTASGDDFTIDTSAFVVEGYGQCGYRGSGARVKVSGIGRRNYWSKL